MRALSSWIGVLVWGHCFESGAHDRGRVTYERRRRKLRLIVVALFNFCQKCSVKFRAWWLYLQFFFYELFILWWIISVWYIGKRHNRKHYYTLHMLKLMVWQTSKEQRWILFMMKLRLSRQISQFCQTLPFIERAFNLNTLARPFLSIVQIQDLCIPITPWTMDNGVA